MSSGHYNTESEPVRTTTAEAPSSSAETYNELLTRCHRELEEMTSRFQTAHAARESLQVAVKSFMDRESALGTPIVTFAGRRKGSRAEMNWSTDANPSTSVAAMFPSGGSTPLSSSVMDGSISPQSPSFFEKSYHESSSVSSVDTAPEPVEAVDPAVARRQALAKLSAHIDSLINLRAEWTQLQTACSQQRTDATTLFQDLITVIEEILVASPRVLAHKIDRWNGLFSRCACLADKFWLLRKRYTTELGAAPFGTAWQSTPVLNSGVPNAAEERMQMRRDLLEDVNTWLIRRTREERARVNADGPGEDGSPLHAAAKEENRRGLVGYRSKVMAKNLTRLLEWAYPASGSGPTTTASCPLNRRVLEEYVDRLCLGEMEGLMSVQDLCRLVPVLAQSLLYPSSTPGDDNTTGMSLSTTTTPPAWLADPAVEAELVVAIGLAQWTEYARNLTYDGLAKLQQNVILLVLGLGEVAVEIEETEPIVPDRDPAVLSGVLHRISLG